jgi:hypothetical protein
MPSVYEDAILATAAVMECAGENSAPWLSNPIKHILLSRTNSTLDESGKMMEAATPQIMTAFARVLDDLMPVATKVAVLAEMGFWEFCLASVGDFGALRLTESAGREAAKALMAAIANGHRAHIIVGKDESLVTLVLKKLR